MTVAGAASGPHLGRISVENLIGFAVVDAPTPKPETQPHSPEANLDALLAQAAAGDRQALENLLPIFYEQLRAIAAARLRKTPPGGTLQATALVHEAYLRLAGRRDEAWQGKAHFFFAASRAMRDVLVERARRRHNRRAREAARSIDASRITDAISAPDQELLALDAALARMAADDPRRHEIVMLRFFGGLGLAEIAELMDVSERTVKRDWRLARARLHDELGGDGVSEMGEPDGATERSAGDANGDERGARGEARDG